MEIPQQRKLRLYTTKLTNIFRLLIYVGMQEYYENEKQTDWGQLRILNLYWAGKKKGDFMGIYEKIGLFCLAIVVGFVYFNADARKPSTSASGAAKTPGTAASGAGTAAKASGAGTAAARAKKTTGVSPQKKGVGSARQAPILKQAGRAQFLKQNMQLTVEQILNILRTTNKNANFIVALDANKTLIDGDPSGAIAHSASVGNIDAQNKKLISAGAPSGITLDSIIQGNLNATVTLKPAPNVIQKMMDNVKLDAASRDAYSQILLYFTLDASAGYNNIWFFIVDPWPFSIVINKAYPAYDIIESW